LISVDGNQLGIVSINEALEAASQEEMDLVEVAPNADPPVCRIMDYGKHKYKTSKKGQGAGQGARKKPKAIQVKEIKLRPHTDEHDLRFKIRNLKKFLDKKNRVKVSLIYRGRELVYIDNGIELLKKIAEEVVDSGTVDQPPKREGRNITMVIFPK